MAFEKVDLAFELIALYVPKKYRSLKMDVSSIFVTSGFPGYGRYNRALKMVKLNASYVTDPETTHQEIACCLIHEAQHGRLFRMGFGYEEAVRTRIERICGTAERNFAHKIPGCEALVEDLEDRIDFDLEPFLSNEVLWRSDIEAKLQSLKNHDVPNWIIRFMEWLIRFREWVHSRHTK